MSALLNSTEHALAAAASDVVKVAKFVEQSVLPVLKKAQADPPTIEAVTALVSPQAANIERVGFAVLGLVDQGNRRCRSPERCRGPAREGTALLQGLVICGIGAHTLRHTGPSSVQRTPFPGRGDSAVRPLVPTLS